MTKKPTDDTHSPKAPLQATVVSAEGQRPRQIMLVEDEAITAMDLKTNLMHLGYQVTAVVTTGEEAILRAAELKPDLILMDITLDGEMTGIEAAAQIQRAYRIPIIYLTAHTDEEMLEQAKQTEPFGYLPKPCNITTLKVTIEVALFKSEADAKRREAEIALHQKEEAIRLSEKRYRQLFRSMHNGFSLHEIICDEQGKPCNYRFLEVNPAFEALTGLKARDIIGKTVLEILPGTEAFWIETFGQVALTGKPTHINNYSAALKRHYEVDAYCPEPGRFACIIVEVTEKLHLEEQFRQAQKMEGIGQFAGGIAHDFNNILTAIMGFGGLALSQMAEDDPQRPNIQQMINASERAASLTKDLLLFTRKQTSAKQPIDLNITIARTEKFLKRIIGEDIECRTTLFDGAALILGDAPQLQQVLMNFATNARDAMPNGGIFSITTNSIVIDEKFIAAHGYGKPGHHIMITVTDTGQGMDKATKEHIFEPFFTTKESGHGTGLGLAVVFGIIQQHDGFITVYSEPALGTTFKITLPLIDLAVKEGETDGDIPPAGGKETILLAEDDDSVRAITTTVLQGAGYRVIQAVDGQDAVEKYKASREKIHLLLFDVIMPKKTGKEAYDEIKRLHPEIKIIFQSGYAPDLIMQKLLIEETITFIEKPISPNKLLKQLRSELDRDRAE